MSISKRLLLAFGASSIALCLTVAAAFFFLAQSQSRFEYVQRKAIPSIVDLDKAIYQTATLRLELYKHMLAMTDSAKSAESEATIAKSLEAFAQLTEHYAKNDVLDAKDRARSEVAKADAATLKSVIPEFIARSNSADVISAMEMFEDKNTGVSRILEKTINDLRSEIDDNTKLTAQLRDENNRAFNLALLSMLLGPGIVLLVVGALTIGVICGIKRSLSGMQGIMSNLSASLDLTCVAPVVRMDEIGHTATAFNSLIDSVRLAIRTVAGTTDAVSFAAQEIASGNADLSTRTEQQAASLEETAASMTQLTQIVKQNADNARQANALATNAVRLADTGNDAVLAMVATIKEINGSSSRVSEITGVIEGIAFQTNILALNAAVEAARAGEQGRGFAVVASEVRSLAQRSAAAAKEIKNLLGSSAAISENGSRQAVEVGATVGQVKQAIKQVSDIVGEIASACEEQSRGIEQVGRAVIQMDEVTQHNASLVEQAAAAAQSLDEQALKLKGAVSAFKLSGDIVDTSAGALPIRANARVVEYTGRSIAHELSSNLVYGGVEAGD